MSKMFGVVQKRTILRQLLLESFCEVANFDEHLDGPRRSKVMEAIGSACETDGFFMVKNHGIPLRVVEGMLRVAREFFHLPESEQLKAVPLSTSFNVPTEKKVSNWRELLRLHCYPLESFRHQWPPNPPAFRQVVGTYSTEVRALALRLLEAISESLGLERGHMVKAMGRHAQQMALNYYPPCPQPELTYGLPAHRDCNAITLILQDGVSGLQVKNHGIAESVMEGMLRMAREFFHLPESERLKCCSDDPEKAIRLSTSFNVPAERVSNWRDVLRLHCYPLESFVDQWPPNPPVFREVVGTYSTEARALALRLLEAISESLGLERGHMVNAMGRHAQQMALNYYPPCPQPELTYGLPGHRDCNAITLLLQDGVSGLQVQCDGRWVAVNSVPNVL